MHPFVPEPGFWKSDRDEIVTAVDKQLGFIESVLGAIFGGPRRAIEALTDKGTGKLEVEDCGLRLRMGDWLFELVKCRHYRCEVPMGDGAMRLDLYVKDPGEMSIQQSLSKGDRWIATASHQLVRVADSATSGPQERTCDCITVARYALEWGAAERAYSDTTLVGSLTTPDPSGALPVTTTAEFIRAIEAQQSMLVKRGMDRALQDLPELDARRRFLAICPEYPGGPELGWVEKDGQHHYNERALKALPDSIVETVEHHEAIHKRQVSSTGWPSTDSADDLRKFASYEAEAYRDSFDRLMRWVEDSCQPGMVPDGYPYINVPLGESPL